MHTDFALSATCVRVPVLRSHSESITITFENDVNVNVDKAREVLSNFENVTVLDDMSKRMLDVLEKIFLQTTFYTFGV
jgi:aspartate-semialdehyde dehydrogenase